MEHTEREHKIEIAEVAVQRRSIADSEFSAAREGATCAPDVRLTDVDADIPHVTEVIEKGAGAAAEVQDAHPRGRTHALPNEQRSGSLAAERSREELIYRRAGQDPSNVDYVAAPPTSLPPPGHRAPR